MFKGVQLFSLCYILLLFEHKKICKVTELKVHSNGRYFNTVHFPRTQNNYNSNVYQWAAHFTQNSFKNHNGASLCQDNLLFVPPLVC